MLKILLDMDGVLCSWEKGVCNLFKLDFEEIIEKWPPGEFSIEKVTGIPEDEIWQGID